MQLLDGYSLDLTAQPTRAISADIAATVYQLVCRTDFNAPGFALLDLGPQCDSITLRTRMVELKDFLSEQHQRQLGQPIVAVWMGRFNQQITTKLHLDGGPDASLLMLGYEPSVVESRVRLGDYSQCASRHGLTPREFLDQHNPMFPAGEALLQPDITDIARANCAHFQILLVNNSCRSQTDGSLGWQGVLHQAIMLVPRPGERRVVNSMLLTTGDLAADAMTAAARHDYLTTDQINQKM